MQSKRLNEVSRMRGIQWLSRQLTTSVSIPGKRLSVMLYVSHTLHMQGQMDLQTMHHDTTSSATRTSFAFHASINMGSLLIEPYVTQVNVQMIDSHTFIQVHTHTLLYGIYRHTCIPIQTNIIQTNILFHFIVTTPVDVHYHCLPRAC